MDYPAHPYIAAGILAMAYYIRGISGYGSGLLAIPSLALFMPLGQVVPVIAVLDLLASLGQALRYRQQVNWFELRRLLPIAITGMALGLIFIRQLNSELLKPWLGGFIVLYALYSLLPHTPRMISRYWSLPLITTGGVIDTLFGTGGPFYVIYLRLRQLDKTDFVATIAMTFMLNLLIRISGYGVAGFYHTDTLQFILQGLPIMALAMTLGMHTQHRLSAGQFSLIIMLLLLAAGLGLLLHS